jgi:hypothetical protein
VNLYDPRTKALVQSIGKARGQKDGSFAEAQFDYAMGLDFTQDSKTLYVAEYAWKSLETDYLIIHFLSPFLPFCAVTATTASARSD